jgi:intein/homing endonuclease
MRIGRKPEHRQRYSDIIERMWGRRPSEDARGLHLYSVDAYQALKALGLGAKAIEKRVPPIVWTLPENERRAFLEGYLDSDGHVNASGAWAFEANNEDLIRDMRDLCIGLGWRVSNVYVRLRPAVRGKHGRLYRPNRPSAAFQTYPGSAKRYVPD